MAKATATLGFPYPETTDSDNVPNDIKALAEAVDANSKALPLSQLAHGTAGQLIVVQSTGAAAYKALKGDATLAEDGTLTIGNDKITAAKIAENAVGSSEIAGGAAGESELADGAVTSRKFKPTAGIVVPSSDLVLTGSYADVPGASLSITPAVASILYVHLIVRRFGGSGPVAGTLKVDAEADLSPSALIGEATGAWVQEGGDMVYAIPLTAAPHTIKMRACKETGTATLHGANSRFYYQLVAS